MVWFWTLIVLLELRDFWLTMAASLQRMGVHIDTGLFYHAIRMVELTGGKVILGAFIHWTIP